ncbi:MAG: AbgT family transporter [Deltaproteobacteria bacterium]|nr:AbgT family transporter [Deltaproteobacteria bacterium]
MTPSDPAAKPSSIARALDAIERAGNRLPDPAILFLALLFVTWAASALLAPVAFSEIDPRTKSPLVVVDLLTGRELARLLADLVKIFMGFHPLGVVLVALLGVGIAEHTGFVGALLRAILGITPKSLLAPAVVAAGLLSHTAADAGYVLVIPVGAAIFHAAGRHPLAGIASAFTGVAGGFSACFVPTSLDPLLQGLTQAAAQLIDPSATVNPLANFYFTASSSVLVIAVGWFLTDHFVEPRLRRVPVDGEATATLEALSPAERRGLAAGLGACISFLLLIGVLAASPSSALRSPSGELTTSNAPLMQGIVALIFLFFATPGVAYGYTSGSVKTHKDIVDAMAKAMGTMSYYMVMAFFASLFIDAFGRSNLGALLALKGAAALRSAALPSELTIVGVTFISASVNLAIGSASAKWALLSPVFVPMLMELGLSPELTQAAYRVGDSVTNIVTPLNPYFPLVVVYAQRFSRSTGIGTLVALMLPFAGTLLVLWSAYLLTYWGLGLPLGLDASYVRVVP